MQSHGGEYPRADVDEVHQECKAMEGEERLNRSSISRSSSIEECAMKGWPSHLFLLDRYLTVRTSTLLTTPKPTIWIECRFNPFVMRRYLCCKHLLLQSTGRCNLFRMTQINRAIEVRTANKLGRKSYSRISSRSRSNFTISRGQLIVGPPSEGDRIQFRLTVCSRLA